MPNPIARFLTFFALASLLLSGCGNESVPETPGSRPIDSSRAQAPLPTGDDSVPGSSPDLTGSPGGAVTGRPPAPESVRSALVDSVRTFVGAIGAGRQEKFWEMLSARSLEAVGTESGGTKEEVWAAARETLGGLKGPSIRFVGGTVDSVSLIVGRTSTEVIDSLNNEVETFDDPVIIHFLREDGRWKAIYPGLLYPERDLR